MNALLRIGDKYAENSSWRDFAVGRIKRLQEQSREQSSLLPISR